MPQAHQDTTQPQQGAPSSLPTQARGQTATPCIFKGVTQSGHGQELQRINQQQLAALRQLSREQDGRKAELEAQLKAEYDAKVEDMHSQLSSLSDSMQRQEVGFPSLQGPVLVQ